MASGKRVRSVKLHCHKYDLTAGLAAGPMVGGGELIADRNLSTRRYPALCPRPHYRTDGTSDIYTSMGAVCGKLFYIQDGKIYYDKEHISTTNIKSAILAELGGIVLLCPSFAVYHIKRDKITSMTENMCNIEFTLKEGTLGGEEAGVNTLVSSKENLTNFYKPGDGIIISSFDTMRLGGYFTVKETNTTAGELRLRKNAFGKTGSYTFIGAVRRDPPALNNVYTCGGRIWGYGNGVIYATSYGETRNWYAFDNGGKSSVLQNSPDGAQFTAIAGADDKPVFFTSERTYLMEGSNRDNFKLKCVNNRIGVPEELSGSVAPTGRGVVFMSSDYRVRYYDGKSFEEFKPLPARRYDSASSGYFEDQYFLILTDADGGKYFYVYDMRHKAWHERDHRQFYQMASSEGSLYALNGEGGIVAFDDNAYPIENYTEETEVINSMAEFSNLYPCKEIPGGEVENRHASLKSLRVISSVEAGGFFKIYVMFDDSGEWHVLDSRSGGHSGTVDIPVLPNRCRCWRLKIEGQGDYTINDLQAFYTR